jgi:hypothetical protein
MKRRTKGVNTIAMIIMFISFFMIVGFGIGALSTLNLNLAGRSVTAVKSRHLAEAAVNELQRKIEALTEESNASVSLEKLSPPPYSLDKIYDGTKSVFEQNLSGLEENSSVSFCFKDENADKSTLPAEFRNYYSTDNSFRSQEFMGSHGMIPPFTFDLIVRVRIGEYVRYYQVWLNRRWDYVIYVEQGPIFLLQCIDFSKNPLELKEGSIVNGNIYSQFSPLPHPSPYPSMIKVDSQTMDNSDGTSTETNVYLNSNMPPDKPYPAAVTIGGQMFREVCTYKSDETEKGKETKTILSQYLEPTPFATSMTNDLSGGSSFSYASPTPSPGYEQYIYPNNNEEHVEESRFSVTPPSIFKRLVPVSETGSSLVNEESFPDALEVHDDDYCGSDRNSIDSNHSSGEKGFDSSEEAEAFAEDMKKAVEDKNGDPDTHREIYLLKGDLNLNATNSGSYQWSASKYIVKGNDGIYRNLVDTYVKVNYWADPSVSEEIDKNGNSRYKVQWTRGRDVTTTSYPVKSINISHGLLMINQSDLELNNIELRGDNCMLQVDGNLKLSEAHISAGIQIGAVIYCKNFYCSSDGTFNGVVFARDSLRIGKKAAGTGLAFKGGIVMSGSDKSNPSSIFDFGGLMCIGFNIDYDSRYSMALNRFGKLRVACWKELP